MKKKQSIVWAIIFVLIILCSLNLKEFRKGKTFFDLEITESLSMEFVRDYDWDMSAGVQVIIHNRRKSMKTAVIDHFTPTRDKPPEYGFVKSSNQVLGIYRIDEPDHIIMLLDTNDLTHTPYIYRLRRTC